MGDPVHVQVSSLVSTAHVWWTSLQVELHGQYSRGRLARLYDYTRTRSWTIFLATAVVGPLPCLVIITLVDCVPLRPPSDGLSANYVFWLRVVVVSITMLFGTTEQLRWFLPQFPLSRWARMGLVTLPVTIAVAQMVLVAHVVGFPAPFNHLLATPTAGIVFVLSVVWLWRDLLRVNSTWRRELAMYLLVITTQNALTVVYPAYVFVFTRLTGHHQTLFVLVLPMIKMAVKNAVSRCLRSRDDLKPQYIILNIETFNALYVSMCMQKSTSRVTTIVLLSIDMIQVWLSLRDMDPWIAKVQTLLSKLPPSPSGRPYKLVDVAVAIQQLVAVHPSPRADMGPTMGEKPGASIETSRSTCEATTRAATSPVTVHPVAPHAFPPQAPDAGGDDPTTTRDLQRMVFHALDASERAQFVKLTRQILFVTEFLMLIEYIEVVIPIVYSVYISAMFFLPNRAFYPQTKDLDAERLKAMISSVFAYTLVEFLSFVVLGLVMRYRLRLSGFHQLAFVLDTQRNFVQANLIVWTLYIEQSTLEHFGVDFSMKFAWLKHD